MSSYSTNASFVRVGNGVVAQISDFHPGTTAPLDSVKVLLEGTTVHICQPALSPAASRLELLFAGRAVLDQLIDALNFPVRETIIDTPSAGSTGSTLDG